MTAPGIILTADRNSAAKNGNNAASLIMGGGPFRRRPFGTADSALDNWAPDITAPFPNLFLFSSYEEKTMKQAIS